MAEIEDPTPEQALNDAKRARASLTSVTKAAEVLKKQLELAADSFALTLEAALRDVAEHKKHEQEKE